VSPSLVQRVRHGEYLRGTFLNLGSALWPSVRLSGFDWLLVDLEHGAGGEEAWRPVAGRRGHGVSVIARTESAERIRVGHLLDLGSRASCFPMETPEEVRAALAHLWYPPRGIVVSPATTGLAASAATASRRRSQRGHFGRRPSGVRHGSREPRRNSRPRRRRRALYRSGRPLGGTRVPVSWSIQCSRTPSTRSSRRQPGTTSRPASSWRSTSPDYRNRGFRFLSVGSDSSLLRGAALEALHLD